MGVQGRERLMFMDLPDFGAAPLTGSSFPDVVFDPVEHVYRVGGVRWPSVTGIIKPLNDFGAMDPEALKRAADFGTNVHAMCHLHNMMDLNEVLLSPALTPYLDAYKLFLAQMKPRILGSEMLVVNRKDKYCGTVDLVLTMKYQMYLIDIKSSAQAPRTAGPQTAGYTRCLMKNRIIKRGCLVLGPEGYRLSLLDDATDFDVFDACLRIYKWRNP